jgi:hypothetical protein
MRLFQVIIFILLSTTLTAQKGSLFLSVFPENAIIRMNDTLLKSHETYLLDTGTYNLKLWLPTREYVERSFNIQSDKTTRFHEVLSYSDEYKKFKRKTFLYHVDKIVLRYVAPVVLGAYIYNIFPVRSKMIEQFDNANAVKENYENSINPADIIAYKSSYESFKKDYDKTVKEYNKRVLIGSGLLITTGILYYVSYKIKKPVFEEKVLLSSFYLNSYNNTLIPSVALTYKIK